ncbi:Homocysteine S-methyltransferase YbgG [Cladophialophora carrionii]|uniref:Homocysteine S-methyltransferase YbgG n=1 Tax=Cladophialophora carrionii TaxID=86049 RepID=A0A1C1CS59_9EURO|nr:Homocysteine S-methyltransferase YbgG [Cladophialophora carrionii]
MSRSLLEEPILVLDGGLGTTLEDEHGVRFSSNTPLWSSHLLVENVETLKRVQRDFADAGADIVLTATYQASFLGFKNTKATSQSGIDEDEARRLMLSAVRIARESFNGRPGLVALSLGAYGATMIPSTEYSGRYGSMTEEDLFQFHSKRLSCFVNRTEWEDVDLVAIETLPRLDEVRATRKAVQIIKHKPYWISCVFPNDDERLPDGTGVEELVTTMLEGERPPYAIGINCTKVHKLPGLLRSFEDSAHAHDLALPRLVIYPDGAGGKVYDTTLQQWMGSDDEESPWEQQVYDIVKEVQRRRKWKGILVGGCCKTTPSHIKKLRAKLDESK